MYNHIQNSSYLKFMVANKTNKKSKFSNHKKKKTAKSVCSTRQRIKKNLCSRKELLLYGHTQKQFFKFLLLLTQLTKVRNCTTTYKKAIKKYLLTSQRLKSNLCDRDEHPYVYDYTQKLCFKISG